MSRIDRIAAAAALKIQQGESAKKIAWVSDIILDETHEYAVSSKMKSQVIGAVKYRTSQNLSPSTKDSPIAYPFDKNFKNLPILNEQIEIYEGEQGSFYYRRIGLDENPTESAFENINAKNFNPEKNEAQKVNSYKTSAETKIETTTNDGSKESGGYGKYYTTQPGIHKLKLYEGDSLIESRFGQSIRFSAYNNLNGPNENDDGSKTPAFAPTIIIRNGQNAEALSKSISESIEEDINRDGSIIAMTSGQHQLGFIPGTVDDKGKSDFKTQPDSFGEVPKLIGDQMLLSSGRIILSSKNAETMIYSKKNFGIITDGAVSIDAKLGMDISVGDDINIVTADRDVNIVSGKGNIFLGSEDLEAMVKGKKLVELLNELLQAILDQQYLTPSGPSAIGPVNKATFASIQSKLDGVLSKLNQTA
jgi:hypothetical protein